MQTVLAFFCACCIGLGFPFGVSAQTGSTGDASTGSPPGEPPGGVVDLPLRSGPSQESPMQGKWLNRRIP